MSEKVKALLWEECRVAGAITLTCWLSGTLVITVFTLLNGATDIRFEPMPFIGYGLCLPIFTGLLLLLNPDTSGALRGGYSRRILQLPVDTFTTVTVTFLARTIFVFLMALLVAGVSQWAFDGAPGFAIAVLIVLLYMLAQLLDWLRGVFSGIVTLLLMFMLYIGYLWFQHDGSLQRVVRFFEDASDIDQWNVVLVLYLMLLAFILYVGSLVIVGATRKGKVYGFPEFWQWRIAFDLPGRTNLRPYASPLSAQVALDLRRSKWLLPVLTIVITLGATLVTILWNSRYEVIVTNPDSIPGSLTSTEIIEHNPFEMYWGVVVPFSAMSLAVFVQGLVLNVLGFSRTKGMPGYTHLLPMTDAQRAYARIIAHLILLAPAIVFVTIVQILVPSPRFFIEILPNAIDIGIVSWREAVWTVISRSYLAGLVLWAVMAISTRAIGKTVGVCIVMSVVMASIFLFGILPAHYLGVLLPAAVIVVTLGTFLRAYRGGVIGAHSLFLWGAVWILAALPLLTRSVRQIAYTDFGGREYVIVVLVSFAFGALVPLPFAAIALDMRKRRHSAAPVHDKPSATHIQKAGLPLKPSRIAAVVCAAGVIVWISIPAPPAYRDAWRAKGYPASLEELDEWYATVPDDENRAMKYMTVAEKALALSNAFDEEAEEKEPSDDETRWDYLDNIAIQGGGEIDPGNGIDSTVREATVDYWEKVTRTVAEDLINISNDSQSASRYPVDMRLGAYMELEHLARTRDLARHASLDSLYWSLRGDPDRAATSVIACFPVADSLANEPILISGLVRLALYGIAWASVETTINVTEHNENSLLRMQRRLEQRLELFAKEPMLRKTLIGESVVTIEGLSNWMFMYLEHEYEKPKSIVDIVSYTPVSVAAMPVGGEVAVSALEFQRLIDVTSGTWEEVRDFDMDSDWEDTGHIAILAWILMPALSRAEEAAWRVYTQFELAIVGLALERYRIAKDAFPDSLEALVPVYIDAVPKDRLALDGRPLGYRFGDKGEAVVYSVSRDGEDDGGVETKDGYYWFEGDMLFTVFPQKSNDLEFVPPPEDE